MNLVIIVSGVHVIKSVVMVVRDLWGMVVMNVVIMVAVVHVVMVALLVAVGMAVVVIVLLAARWVVVVVDVGGGTLSLSMSMVADVIMLVQGTFP